MAYAIDLDDDVAESDIPTTVIRSKADLTGIEVSRNYTFIIRVMYSHWPFISHHLWAEN